MSSAFSIPCKNWANLLPLIFLWACSSNAPREPEYEPPTGVSSASSAAKGKPITSGIQMTYHNDASTLNMTLDPYDENLQIEMKRIPRPVEVKQTKPEPPPKKDTVYIMQPQQPQQPQVSTIMSAPPTSVNVQLQLPPEQRRDSTGANGKKEKSLQESEKEIQTKDVTDEVLNDIRRAQDYFYKKDYSSVLRLLKSAQEKRVTAEAYSLQGSTYYMLGDRDLARYYWGEALKVNPQMPDVIEALSKLDPKPGVP